MGCSFPTMGFELDLAFAAFLIFGSAALPFLQSAMAGYVAGMIGFVGCMMML